MPGFGTSNKTYTNSVNLIKEMGGDPRTSTHDLYAVEGGTAAMCYIFDSLKANELMIKGDKIALMVPIFTPYLDIPKLPRYDFDITYILKELTMVL